MVIKIIHLEEKITTIITTKLIITLTQIKITIIIISIGLDKTIIHLVTITIITKETLLIKRAIIIMIMWIPITIMI